jgi:F420H(2)-dependent quinone reductase
MTAWSQLASEQYCYPTTTGRVTGHPHRIEIWFAIDQDTLYMLSGGGDRSDWVKNLRREPAVTVQIGTVKFEGPGAGRRRRDRGRARPSARL